MQVYGLKQMCGHRDPQRTTWQAPDLQPAAVHNGLPRRLQSKKKKENVQGLWGLPSEDADFHSDQHSGLWLLDSGIAKERGGENMDALIGRKRPPFKAPEVLVIFL